MSVTIIRPKPEELDPAKVRILQRAIVDICLAAGMEPERKIRPGHPEDEPKDFFQQVLEDNIAWHERQKNKDPSDKGPDSTTK